MLVIADNGEEYSDHGVYFIEVPTKLYKRFGGIIDELITNNVITYGRPSILMTAEKVTVVDPGTVATLPQKLNPATMVKDGKLTDSARALPFALLDYLVKTWPGAGQGGAALVPFLLHHAQLKKEARGR